MSRQGKNIDQSGTTVKVFYNSACPVCDSGCRLIRNELNSSESSGDAEWLDIHENPAAIDELNSNLEQARERLHVIDTEGRQRVGIDAFIAIWSLSSAHRLKARFFSLPIVNPVAQAFYALFAKTLYYYNKLMRRW